MESKLLIFRIFTKFILCLGLAFSALCGIFMIIFPVFDRPVPKYMRVTFVIGCLISAVFNLCNYIKTKKEN